MELREKIYYCRKKSGLSQEALAEKLGVSRQAISKWENGDSEPEISKLHNLAVTFNVTTDWLLSMDDPEEEYRCKSESEYEYDSTPENSSKSAKEVDAVLGIFGKLIRKYGWLTGIYIALSGGFLTLLGGMMRVLFRGMGTLMPQMSGPDVELVVPKLSQFSDFDNQFNQFNEQINNQINNQAESANSTFTAFGTMTNTIANVGIAVMILGILLIITGIVLAVVLKKRSKC